MVVVVPRNQPPFFSSHCNNLGQFRLLWVFESAVSGASRAVSSPRQPKREKGTPFDAYAVAVAVGQDVKHQRRVARHVGPLGRRKDSAVIEVQAVENFCHILNGEVPAESTASRHEVAWVGAGRGTGVLILVRICRCLRPGRGRPTVHSRGTDEIEDVLLAKSHVVVVAVDDGQNDAEDSKVAVAVETAAVIWVKLAGCRRALKQALQAGVVARSVRGLDAAPLGEEGTHRDGRGVGLEIPGLREELADGRIERDELAVLCLHASGSGGSNNTDCGEGRDELAHARHMSFGPREEHPRTSVGAGARLAVAVPSDRGASDGTRIAHNPAVELLLDVGVDVGDPHGAVALVVPNRLGESHRRYNGPPVAICIERNDLHRAVDLSEMSKDHVCLFRDVPVVVCALFVDDAPTVSARGRECDADDLAALGEFAHLLVALLGNVPIEVRSLVIDDAPAVVSGWGEGNTHDLGTIPG